MLIEIIVESGTKTDVLNWLGIPKKEIAVSDGVSRFEYGGGVVAILTDEISGRDWLSVCLEGFRWEDSLSCAKEAEAKIRKVVIVDPGDDDPNPFKFTVIRNGIETIEYYDV